MEIMWMAQADVVRSGEELVTPVRETARRIRAEAALKHAGQGSDSEGMDGC